MQLPSPACPLSRRRVLGLAAGGLAATLGAAGCHQTSAPVDDAEFDALLTAWTRAVRDQDRSAHDRMWAAAAPELANRLADSLLGLPLTKFAATRVKTTDRAPEGPRVVEVAWRLPGEATQRHRLPLVASRVGGTPALAPGELAPPAAGTDAPPMPLWWLQPTVALTGSRTGLLVGGVADPSDAWAGKPLSEWQQWADRAATVVTDRTGRATGAAHRVWFELPSSTEMAQRLLGGGATFGSIAALATVVGHPGEDNEDDDKDDEEGDEEGDDEDGEETPAPVHVVLDPPQLGALAEGSAVSLLAHEAVHVVTAAPHTDLPLWVEEGWAEAVGWADSDEAGWSQASRLLREIRSEEVTIAIPSDQDFNSDSDNGNDLTTIYALAWSVCRWMVAEGRRRGANDDGWALPRQWYDRLAPPDGSPGISEEEACTIVLEMSPADRERRWRDWLIAQATTRL